MTDEMGKVKLKVSNFYSSQTISKSSKAVSFDAIFLYATIKRMRVIYFTFAFLFKM